MRTSLIVWLVVAVMITAPASAADLYVVQGDAQGQVIPAGGERITWTTDAFFYNRGASSARIRLLGVSNGGLQPGTSTELNVAPQRTATLSASLLTVLWRPLNSDPLWVLHLDVPETVLTDDELFIGAVSLSTPFFNTYKYGKVRLPVYSSLVPANQLQVHLATNLGGIPSHANVAVYNAGPLAATAVIEIHRHCDDATIASSAVTVASDTIMQFTGFPAVAAACNDDTTAPIGGVYVLVAVDQPSFSFVSNVANNDTPMTSIAVSAGQ
jgi:hypothetical protein